MTERVVVRTIRWIIPFGQAIGDGPLPEFHAGLIQSARDALACGEGEGMVCAWTADDARAEWRCELRAETPASRPGADPPG